MLSAEYAMNRRVLLRNALTVLGLPILLAACGFHLRGTTAIPAALQNPYIEGVPATDPLARELSMLLVGNGATPVNAPEDASAIISIMDQSRSEDVRAVGESGGAVDFELTYRVMFSSKGVTVPFALGKTDVVTTGSYAYPEADALQRAEGKRLVEQDLTREAALVIVERIRAVAGP